MVGSDHRDAHDTRPRILDAARELFVRDGVEAVTMRAIAARIGLTPTAIYHHFRDKQALLQDLCEHDFRALAAAFLRIGRVADPVERLRRIGEAYVRFAVEHPGHYRFMFMTPAAQGRHDGEPGNPEEDAYAFLHQTVREAITAGRFRPELDDPDLVAQMCWAMVHGIASIHVVFRDDPWLGWTDPMAVAHAALDMSIRGLVRAPA